MVYRAKITNIQAYIEDNYNIDAYHIVTDSTDKYIEFRDEEEASLIDAINRAQLQLIEAVLKHRQYISEHE